MVNYIPKQGDIVELDFSPIKGREQRGRRPAMVINGEAYYRKTGLLIVCPISNTENNFPLHIELGEKTKTTGSVLTQHIRTIDPEARPVLFIEQSPPETIERVLGSIDLFFVK